MKANTPPSDADEPVATGRPVDRHADDRLVEVGAGQRAVAGGCAEGRHVAGGVDLVVAGAVIEGRAADDASRRAGVDMQVVWTGPGVAGPAPGSVWNQR